jgi:hypothetical protein
VRIDAPLSMQARRVAVRNVVMLQHQLGDALDPADLAVLENLSNAASDRYLLHRDDLFLESGRLTLVLTKP